MIKKLLILLHFVHLLKLKNKLLSLTLGFFKLILYNSLVFRNLYLYFYFCFQKLL